MSNLKVIADEMLPVYENEDGEKFVDARELHEKLVSKQEFANWIKRRIDNFGFAENEDFFSFDTIIKRETGATKRKDYMFTLDTGKEIAMVENSEMGRIIRKYFIEVEKRFRQKPKSQLEVLQIAVNQMVEMDKKVKALEDSVSTITTSMTTIPNHSKVVDTVNEYARYTRLGHDDVYNGVYKILKAQHGIDVKARVENERRKINAEHYEKTGKLYAESTLKKKINGVDVMVRMNVLDKFYYILVGLLAKAKGIEVPV